MMGMLMRGEEERGRGTSEKLRGEEERFLLVADAAWELHLAAPARESVPHGDAQFLAWQIALNRIRIDDKKHPHGAPPPQDVGTLGRRGEVAADTAVGSMADAAVGSMADTDVAMADTAVRSIWPCSVSG